MQINLNLDESLLNEAFQVTNLTSQEELVNLALQELVRSRRKKSLLDLAGRIQVELTIHSWQAAARIYYDLRRQGLSVRSPIDCCIAQAGLENNLGSRIK
jgi:predicted nucleic acid-binding protein